MNGDPEKKKGLMLRGNLQIDTAERALQRYKTGSKVLKLIIDLKDIYSKLPEHMRPTAGMTGISFYIDDVQLRQDVVDALRLSLKYDELDDFDRAGIEELLTIQEADDLSPETD